LPPFEVGEQEVFHEKIPDSIARPNIAPIVLISYTTPPVEEMQTIKWDNSRDEYRTDERRTDERRTDERRTDERRTDERRTDERRTDDFKHQLENYKGQNVLIEVSSNEEIKQIMHNLPKSGPSVTYALITDKNTKGDPIALRKATYIALGKKMPADIANYKITNGKLKGWLVKIHRLEDGTVYEETISYIDPEMYVI
jgi:superfamily II DNA or RNA helicase